MATAKERAVELKNQGNKAFGAHDWPTAIDFYTQAIGLDDQEPTYFTNRAQVRFAPQPDAARARVTDSTAGQHQVGSLRLCDRRHH